MGEIGDLEGAEVDPGKVCQMGNLLGRDFRHGAPIRIGVDGSILFASRREPDPPTAPDAHPRPTHRLRFVSAPLDRNRHRLAVFHVDRVKPGIVHDEKRVSNEPEFQREVTVFQREVTVFQREVTV
jgi:hypothetical protein